MSVTVRSATTADKETCLALLNDLSSATGGSMSNAAESVFDLLLGKERGQILVAEADGRLLGMATLSYNLAMRYGGEYCQLEELIVTPAARGRNAGGLLVEAMLLAASERGCVECGLYLVETTAHNRPFYEKYGFKTVGDEMRQPLEPC